MYKANTNRIHETTTTRKLLTIRRKYATCMVFHHENEGGDIDQWFTKRLFVLNILAERNYNLRECC